MKRTTNRTMKRTTLPSMIAAGIALAIAIAPGAAFAATSDFQAAAVEFASADADTGEASEDARSASSDLLVLNRETAASHYVAAKVSSGSSVSEDAEDADSNASVQAESDADESASSTAQVSRAVSAALEEIVTAETEKTDKLLSYDPADIAAIGTQEQTGHSICCPSFSCAYADAVMDGTVHDHSYYTCSCCTWTDWGGGASSDRYVGTDEQLLREAYDQILAGRPTVIHVAAAYGEHWIALIGYTGAADPDHLSLANFIALDPWDGAQIVASDRFSLYGDGCEHVSDR